MIPSLEYVKPLDDMEVAKYSQIRLQAEPEVATYWPRGTSSTVTLAGRPLVPTTIAGTP